jgi:CheY-like chemotaxis protein
MSAQGMNMSHDHIAAPLVVLVVEDDGPVRRTVVGFLRAQDCTVFEAVTGEQALFFLDRAQSIDVVFTDLRLGGALTGWDVGEAFRGVCRDIGVVYGTGNPLEPQRPLANSCLLVKPYEFDSILDACVQRRRQKRH